MGGKGANLAETSELVEKAAATINQEDAQEMADKFMSGGKFDFNDLAKQMQQMRKMGGVGSLVGMLPGMGKMKDALKNANIDDKMVKRQEAIIQSMTPAERKNADLLQASRKRRIAAGAGVDVADVNRLIKQFMEMQKMMKQVQKLGKSGFMRAMMPRMMGRDMAGLNKGDH